MKQRNLIFVFCTFISAIAVINVAVFWGYFVDDAYISFRYLNNLLAGKGLVFNPGERVESFSNFLWIMILSPFSIIGLPLTVSSRVLGAAFFLSTIFLSKKIIDEISPRSRQGNNFFLPLLIASCPHLGFWATAGLETMAFAFLLCSSTYLVFKDSFNFREQLLLLFSCFSLTLCRPEGIVPALIFYVYKVWWQKEKKPILINAALLLTFVLAMVALRYTYYHEVLPQTFFVKSGTLLERLGGAFSHTFEAASSVGGIVAVLFPLAVLYKVRNRKVWLLFSVLLFYLVFQLRFGWDWMPFYRFFTPYLPLFFAIYVLFSGSVLQSTKSRMLLISALILWMNVWATYYMKDGISAFYQPETNAHPYYQIAKELNGLAEEHDYVLYDEMGLIPFYSKAKFLDAIGLTDKFIGQTIYRNRIGDEPIMFRYFPMVFDYVKNKRPKVVILLSIHLPISPSFPESLKKTWPYHVYHSSWFKKSYNHYKSFGRYHLFLRTDG